MPAAGSTSRRTIWITGSEAYEEFGLHHNQLYEYHRYGSYYLGGKRLRARRRRGLTAHGHSRSDLWQFDRRQVKRIADGRASTESRAEGIRDRKGRLWLPASVASLRYGIAVQHLERWRDNPCSFLGGKKLRAGKIRAATSTGTLWLY